MSYLFDLCSINQLLDLISKSGYVAIINDGHLIRLEKEVINEN